MKSRIRVDFDRTNSNSPIITLIRSYSDDVRDELLADFIYRLGYNSSWLRIDQTHEDREHHYYKISPITPEQLREQAANMIAAAEEVDKQAKSLADTLRQRAEEIGK